MESPAVSIVVPVYNQADVLPTALESCLSQTYQSIEIIVVDDGSPDDVLGAVKSFGRKVRLIQQENRGLSSARNTGLSEARGEFVKFLDADDWLLPECLDRQANVLRGLSHHIAFIGTRLVFEGIARPDEEVFPQFGRLCYALCYGNVAPVHALLFRTQDVRELGGFSTDPRVQGGHEDYDLTCRMAVRGFEAVIVSEIGCVYRQTPSSMSQNQATMLRTRAEVSRHYFESLLDRPCNNDMLVHVLAGCSERLLAKEFGVESLSMAVNVLDRLKAGSEQFSVYCTDKLALILPHLMTALAMQRGQAPGSAWQLCVDLALDLCKKVSHPNLAWILAEIANSLIGAGEIGRGRIMLSEAISTPGPRAVERLGFRVLRLLTYVLGGRNASLLWGRLRTIVAALMGLR